MVLAEILHFKRCFSILLLWVFIYFYPKTVGDLKFSIAVLYKSFHNAVFFSTGNEYT